MIAPRYYCGLTTAKSTLFLLTLTCLSSYEQRKRFVSIKITGTRICGENSVQEIFLDAFSVVCRLHYLATAIDFLATLAFFCFSCEGHRTTGIEAPDPQKSKIKHVSPILSETMDGKIRLKSSLYDHSNLGHADKHRKQKTRTLVHAVRTILQ